MAKMNTLLLVFWLSFSVTGKRENDTISVHKIIELLTELPIWIAQSYVKAWLPKFVEQQNLVAIKREEVEVTASGGRRRKLKRKRRKSKPTHNMELPPIEDDSIESSLSFREEGASDSAQAHYVYMQKKALRKLEKVCNCRWILHQLGFDSSFDPWMSE